MSIKRYDVGMTTENNPHGFNHSFPWIYEAEQGKYVEYDDYARLKAEVERLTKWQPIETAPRDGTEIIGRAGLWVEVTAFFKGTKPWERKEAWVTSNDDDGYAQDFKPTHWLPLPEYAAKKGKQP